MANQMFHILSMINKIVTEIRSNDEIQPIKSKSGLRS